jgi:type IV pilus assembly protein PilO
MDKLKKWVALTALAVFGISAAGWFLLVSPKKSEAADLNAQAVSQDDDNDVLRNSIKTLQVQAKDLPKQRTKLAAVAAKLPADPAIPRLIRALTAASDASGVKLVSLTPGTPVPVVSGPASAATPATAGAAVGLTRIPIQLSVYGGYFEAQQFLAELESLPRAFRVTGVTLAPGADPGTTAKPSPDAATDGDHLSTAITGEVYMSAASATTTISAAGVTGAGR